MNPKSTPHSADTLRTAAHCVAVSRTVSERLVYEALLERFREGAGTDPEARWHWLEAAHIVGQLDLRMHLHSHYRMLSYAAELRDWPEAVGQMFRLALVPVGHALDRLPAGNIGRATVNAFRPTAVESPVRELIAEVRREAAESSRTRPSH